MAIHTEKWSPGTPCWADIGEPDPDAARAFYSAVLGWHVPPSRPEDGGYAIADVDGHPVAAIGAQSSPDQPVAWNLYLACDDVDATAAAITAAGGTVIVEPGDVGPHGRMAVAMDPTGAAFSVWQATGFPGAAWVNAPGGITWEDLRSTDPKTTWDFYGQVFGVTTQTVDMAPGDYRTFHVAGQEAPVGGMGGFMGPPGPSHWLVYFGVADAAAATAAAEQGGGSIVAAPFDTPFGTMATIADPAGAVFQIVETSAD